MSYLKYIWTEKTARLQIQKTCEADRNYTRIHLGHTDIHRSTLRHINIHTLKVSVVEVVTGTVVVVAIKVTKQVATERILAGRAIIKHGLSR